ncbi:leucyl/phenylalanyl-tRNA--protein transferase [Limnohabitans sp.]|uniref:leucyl/phenylalanyl-tRNA--protein transferase n=1 Tax=Limnohabitans sp. TaxID=1907725 RepID=UPI00286F85A4|nr:leucyl/phenylalanyl-tRNA--protein transferase [Limnohabitans sp.]
MPLPHAESAQPQGTELAGLVAAGGGLSTQRLCEAYSQGMFPWFSEGQPVLWWSPDPRMVLKPGDFKLHRSLRKTIQKFMESPDAELKIDSAFSKVITHCAQASRAGQAGTWIVRDMIDAYVALHEAGFAHSVETWVNGQLTGGLYCIAIGRAVFGESMFALQTDASKIALAGLVALGKANHVPWIDCQQNTRHLASLGAKEIDRSTFLTGITTAQHLPSINWQFEPIHWQELLATATHEP